MTDGPRHYCDSKGYRRVLLDERVHLDLPLRGPVSGLALSGGGIRSASFALGVLQALYGFRVFDRFDYLSTVSGGGYIGSALTYFRNVFAFIDDAGRRINWFPFGYLRRQSTVRAFGTRTEKPAEEQNLRAYEIVNYLRQHASFLTPSRTLDRPAMAAGVLRGLVSSVLPYTMILVGGLGLLLAVAFFDARADLDGVRAANALDALDATDGGESSPYLALLPAALALGFLALTLLSALAQVLRSSRASRGKEDNVKAVLRYRNGIACLHLQGNLLLWVGGALALAVLPWLHDYLASLAESKSDLPTTFGALFAALAGAAAQVAKLRSIIGGRQSEPTMTKSLLMALAGVAFVFGVILLGFILGFRLAELSRSCLLPWMASLGVPCPAIAAALVGPLLCAAIGVALALSVNVNHANQHRLYRDRLMEVFCAEEDALKNCQWRAANLAQTEKGYLRNMTAVRRPLHLINTTMIASDSDDRRFRGRGGDNFILSPLYCGSDATGWVRTEIGMPALSIATAAAVSGAALNAHAGPHGSGGLRNKAYAALLSFLGLNLGYWARNPLKFAGAAQGAPPPSNMPNLIRPGLANISGRELDERGSYVLLSDGGHFENLALYELIRRRVAFLWISDAGQDTGFSFEDLSCAIERVRVDFGANIRFQDDAYDLAHLIPGSAEAASPTSKTFAEAYKLARRGYAIGTISYMDGSEGIIVYVKATLTRHLPGDIYGYKVRNKDFPHQTTLDQFFDEEQFEAYRELGYRLSAQLFRDIKAARAKANTPSGTTGSEALDRVAAALGL